MSEAARPLTAAAFGGPSAVTDVNPNSLSSGTLYGGRTVNFAVDPGNTQIVFAATEFGGLWKSTNHGASWSHVDQVPLTAMEDVKFAASDANLLIATGAYDGSVDNRGGGIWRSTDGGSTWAKAPGSDVCSVAQNNGREIAIAPGTPGKLTVLVGTDCGIARSTDSGASWKLVNPPGNFQIWDVKVRQVGANLQVDACGDGGYVRSNDGGSTWPTETDWTAATFPHPSLGSPPTPRNPFDPCRVATAPQDANTVFMATRSPVTNPGDNIGETYQFESDDGGVNWHNLNVSIDGNGRDPGVLAFPAFDGLANHFEVFFLTDRVVMHLTCDTNNAQRCSDGTGANTTTCQPPPKEGVSGAWLQYDGTNPHNCGTDPGDLAYDPGAGCPFLEGGDGGIFETASASDGCNVGSPNFATFTPANAGLHALWIYQLAGTAVSAGTAVNPSPHTDVYYGTQDNGQVCSNDDAATFHRCGADGGTDTFNTISPSSGPPVTVLRNEDCGFSLSQEDGTTATSWTSPPVPAVAGKCFLDAAVQFGSNSFAFITHDNATPANYIVQVTTNAGTSWTQMGPTLPGPPSGLPNGEQAIKFAGTSSSPIFYLELTVAGTPTIYKLQGPLNGTATLTAASTGLINPYTYNVDPANPLLLYTVDRGGKGTAKFSTDGGTSWKPDAGLTSITTLGNVYPFISAAGPNVNSFGFDPASNTILVGTQFSGIFASADGGATWATVLGSQQIPRVLDFFFDTRHQHTAYVGSQGRGAWKLDLTPRPATLAYNGDTSGDFHDQVTLAASLYDQAGGPSVPIIGAAVNLTLGTQGCNNLITDATGHVSCQITLDQAPGSYSVVATFAGNAQWSAVTTTTPFTINREETAVTYTGPTVIANGFKVTLSGVLKEDGTVPIQGRSLTLTLGSGATAQSCVAMPTDATGAAGCSLTVNQPLGPGTVSAAFLGDAFYLPSQDTRATIMFGFPARGDFVIGDGNAGVDLDDTFWGAQWASANTLSGGPAPDSFKGYASSTTEPPSCTSWTGRPGNSGHPPDQVPAYMGVIVSTSITKTGPSESGDSLEIIVVKTDPGYEGNPGHPGTGTVVASPSNPGQPAVYCHS